MNKKNLFLKNKYKLLKINNKDFKNKLKKKKLTLLLNTTRRRGSVLNKIKNKKNLKKNYNKYVYRYSSSLKNQNFGNYLYTTPRFTTLHKKSRIFEYSRSRYKEFINSLLFPRSVILYEQQTRLQQIPTLIFLKTKIFNRLCSSINSKF